MPTIEPLEARIAPASITLTYTDHDGDIVKIKASKAGPDAPPLDLADLTFIGGGDSGQLATLHLADPGFEGASITFTVVRKPGGDGLAHVGRIDATGIHLGKVTVKGDLGVIDAGDGTGTALSALVVRSMGVFGTATQGGGDLQSDLLGAVGSISVLGDIKHAHLNLAGGTEASLGKFILGGDLIGGTTLRSGTLTVAGSITSVLVRGDLLGGSAEYAGGIDVLGSIGRVTVLGSVIGNGGSFFTFGGPALFHEGQIFAGLDMGPVKIGGHVIGTTGGAGGEIRAGGDITSITIGGSLIGGSGLASGHLCAEGNMGPVKIGGSVMGGAGAFTGHIEGFGNLGTVTIGGSLIGGPGSVSGLITAIGTLGVVKMRGDFLGGSISGSQPSIDSSGYITANRIAGVSVGGSIFAGYDTSTNGDLFRNGSIVAVNDIGFIAVRGNVIGSETPSGLTRVFISARGQVTPTETTDLAIGKITIGGRVELALIRAGYSADAPANGNAQIGPVFIGGDWRASSLVAGILDNNANGFGNADDTVIAQPPGAATDAIIARIASVTIKGLVLGTAAPVGDHFGFTAQQIGSFSVNGTKLALTTGTDAPFPLAPLTSDVALREVG